MKITKLLSVGILSAGMVAGLTSCEYGEYAMGTKETIGLLGGAAAGGLAGSQIGKGSGRDVAIGVGTLLGAFIGQEIGKSLDKADQLYAAQATGAALETGQTGQTTSWTNPDSGNHGTVTPIKTVYADSGEPCREYQTTVTVGGETVDAYGTACRNPDGTWRIVD